MVIELTLRDWDVLAPPADWADERDRWQIAHAVRTGAAILAFGCLLKAAVPYRRAEPSART